MSHKNMKTLSTLLIIFSSILILNACSNEAWYKGSKTSHEISCLKESKSDYETCINENKHSHDEYELAKDQLNKDGK